MICYNNGDPPGRSQREYMGMITTGLTEELHIFDSDAAVSYNVRGYPRNVYGGQRG